MWGGARRGADAAHAPCLGSGGQPKLGRVQSEDRMVGRIGKLLELGTNLTVPALPVSGDDRRPLGDRDIDGRKECGPPARPDLTASSRAQVPHPLGIAAGRDQVAMSIQIEHVDRDAAGRPLRRPGTVSEGKMPRRINNGLKTRRTSQGGLKYTASSQ